MDKAKRAERSKRYRETHRRIDYVPSTKALAVIEYYRKHFLETSLVEVLDHLIIDGGRRRER